jgi:hypothetical protein
MFPQIPIRYDTLWLNKVTIPVVLIIVIGWLYLATGGNRECEDICLDKGFSGHRYNSSGKHSEAAGTCRCLTLEEAQLKSRIPEGTVVPMQ